MQKKWQNEKKDRMMSDKKAVFFDADGTICDIEKGVPDSARHLCLQESVVLTTSIWI